MEFVAKNLFPCVAEGELPNFYNQIWFKQNPPEAPTPSTEGGKLIDTKKNSANLRVNSFTPRLKNTYRK